jgi:hypothetical protein
LPCNWPARSPEPKDRNFNPRGVNSAERVFDEDKRCSRA